MNTVSGGAGITGNKPIDIFKDVTKVALVKADDQAETNAFVEDLTGLNASTTGDRGCLFIAA